LTGLQSVLNSSRYAADRMMDSYAAGNSDNKALNDALLTFGLNVAPQNLVNRKIQSQWAQQGLSGAAKGALSRGATKAALAATAMGIDKWLNDEESDFAMAKKGYLALGYTEEQAENQIKADCVRYILGEGVSGAAEGAVTAGLNMVRMSHQAPLTEGQEHAITEESVFDWEKVHQEYLTALHGKSEKAHTANKINDWWKKEKNYENSPYKNELNVYEMTLEEDTTFVRVYDGDNSHQAGNWFMRREDVEGLTPRQIQEKYALPQEPRYITEVIIPKGTNIRMGIANAVEGWGAGGGIQFDLMNQRIGTFINPRKIQERIGE